MPSKLPNKKKLFVAIITLSICIPICLIIILILPKHLDNLQMFIVIISLLVVISLIEIFVIWWENRKRRPDILDGPFEMIDLRGTVKEKCAPEGTVEINNEIWNAVSSNGEFINSGETVIVKDRQSLKLIVQRITDRI